MRYLILLLGFMAMRTFATEIVVTDVNGLPIAGVVVDVIGPTASGVRQQYEIVQSDYQFQPAVLIIKSGDQVIFPNQDRISHHVYSFSPAKAFELPLHRAGETTAPVTFEQPGVVAIGCNIHDSMQAHIYVTASGEAALTDRQGRVSVTGQTVRLWHPRMQAADRQRTHAIRDGQVIALSQPLRPERMPDGDAY